SPTRGSGPLLRNCGFPRAGTVHRSENAESHSIARELQNPTRGRVPPLGNYRIPRAGTVHRSGNAESHAQDWSTAQKLHFPARWNSPPFFTSAFKVICEAGK